MVREARSERNVGGFRYSLTTHLLTSHLSPLKKNVKHVLTHRILYADFWLWETNERPQLPDDYFWIKEEEIGNYGVPRLIEILLESLNTEQI